MASSRLLLPWPLSPKKTLKRGPGERSRSARLRKPRTRSRSTRSADMPLDAHRHHDADEARRRVADRLENARIELARELQRDLVLAQRSEHVEQVARVEADRHRVARVVDVELLAALADLRALADDAQQARLHHEADAAALVARDEADAPQRLHQALPP